MWNGFLILLFNLGVKVNFNSGFYHFTVIAVFCNSCVNPFLYVIKYSTFQRAAKVLFCCRDDTELNAVMAAYTVSTYTTNTTDASKKPGNVQDHTDQATV